MHQKMHYSESKANSPFKYSYIRRRLSLLLLHFVPLGVHFTDILRAAFALIFFAKKVQT
jgi:hypothetical protein